jgi:hypothetical protein
VEGEAIPSHQSATMPPVRDLVGEEAVPSTFQALAVVVFALLPGALYVWGFERQAGRYGIGLSDRVLRFVGGSAVFLSLFAAPLYWLMANYREALLAAEPLPGWLALPPIAYVVLPFAVGSVVGYGQREGWSWVGALTGPDPAPRAWDYVFRYRVDGWIRCRLKSGTWLGGAYADANGRRSYAAGYPEPQDLYLAASAAVDEETGEFLLNEHGQPLLGSGGLLLRWEEVEYLEFIDA